MTEERLLQQARTLDPQALAQIYDQFSPGVYRYALRLLGDQDLAEDCLAETFTRLLEALHRRRGPRHHLQAYLYRIAHNWIVDRFRSGLPDLELSDTMASEVESPELDAARHLRRMEIRAALRALTPEQSQVIALKYLEGWENAEIAQAMRKPVGAIKSLQHRALAALRKRLREEEHG